MKKQQVHPLFTVFGLLLLAVSFFVKRLTALPDFADGLMKGAAIGLLLTSIIKQRKLAKTEQ